MNELLPPNSTTHERNLATVAARLGDIAVPLRDLTNPDTCPLAILPWLAWHLGADRWQDYWSEAEKRDRVRRTIPIAKKKGTVGAVRAALAAFGVDLILREWWELTPPGTPGTFDVVLTVHGREGTRITADLVRDVLEEIDRTKRLSAHYTFTQGVTVTGTQPVAGAIRPALYRRLCLTEATFSMHGIQSLAGVSRPAVYRRLLISDI
ncbi:phage tail protein I [Paraburkholderia aspalathi]|uniref:Phage tail protein, P2 protein I family n=1 Tax=Paraburkholderia aspalathi TaxID=1324617 RepID=A0A1I7EL73_9BURK|nr:phage tail protein I [Paraburkholderia aspalathi]SFU24698.1 phage tail protein, P2 protein I family [Paraburkholderia aspalathi]